MVLLAALALIVIGPKQLPEVARTLGRFINELKRVTGDVTKTIVDARDSTNEELHRQNNVTPPTATAEPQFTPAPHVEPKFEGHGPEAILDSVTPSTDPKKATHE